MPSPVDSIYLRNRRIIRPSIPLRKKTLDLNLHSPARRLIELRIEHADLDALVDISSHAIPIDELMLRRLKKRRLSLRDKISQLELSLDPPQPA